MTRDKSIDKSTDNSAELNSRLNSIEARLNSIEVDIGFIRDRIIELVPQTNAEYRANLAAFQKLIAEGKWPIIAGDPS